MRLSTISCLRTAGVLAALATPAAAQHYMRGYVYPGTNYAQNVVELPDGDTVFANAAGSTSILARLDPSGNVLWSNTYFDASDIARDNVKDLAVTADGHVVACGFANGLPWIFKVDSVTGAPMWEIVPNVNGGALLSVVGLPDGTIAAAGWHQTARGDADFWVVKMSSTGAVLWQKVMGSFGQKDVATSLELTRDGGFLVAGYIETVNDQEDLLLMKLDGSGAPQWSRLLGTPFRDATIAARAVETGDGYFVTGSRDSLNDEDFWCVKLNSIGNTIWRYTYELASEGCSDIVATPDGGCLLAGDLTRNGETRSDVALLKLHPNGLVDWGTTYGGSDTDFTMGARLASNGDYLIAGVTQSFLAISFSPLMLRIDASGQIGGDSPYIRSAGFQLTWDPQEHNNPGPMDVQTLLGSIAATSMTVKNAAYTDDVRAITHAGQWNDEGYGIAGSDGVPALYGFGRLEPGLTAGCLLHHGRPGAPVILVIGLDALHLPFKGSVLVPDPQFFLFLPPTDVDGVLTLSTDWPAGLQPGTEVYLQAVLPDPMAAKGIALTNAVRGVTP